MIALTRVTPLPIEKKKVLMNSFFDSQFNYFPLVSMCHCRRNNIKINNHHERCLRLIYSDKKSSYEEFLEKRWISLYSPPECLGICNRNVWSKIWIYTRTVYHESRSISYLRPKIWAILLASFKKAVSLNSFKKLIK